MKVTLIAYGIAKDILETKSTELIVEEGVNISNLKSSLIAEFPEFENLQSLKFAVGVDYQDDTYLLQDNDEVVIIPPVSGG